MTTLSNKSVFPNRVDIVSCYDGSSQNVVEDIFFNFKHFLIKDLDPNPIRTVIDFKMVLFYIFPLPLLPSPPLYISHLLLHPERSPSPPILLPFDVSSLVLDDRSLPQTIRYVHPSLTINYSTPSLV